MYPDGTYISFRNLWHLSPMKSGCLFFSEILKMDISPVIRMSHKKLGIIPIAAILCSWSFLTSCACTMTARCRSLSVLFDSAFSNCPIYCSAAASPLQCAKSCCFSLRQAQYSDSIPHLYGSDSRNNSLPLHRALSSTQSFPAVSHPEKFYILPFLNDRYTGLRMPFLPQKDLPPS